MTTALTRTAEPPQAGAAPFQFEPARLRVVGQPTYEQWAAIGRQLQAMRDHVMWWLGDWWLWGERVYGEMASQEAQEELECQVGYAYDTVRLSAWVASRYEPDARATDLSWRHHKEAAAIEDRTIRAHLLSRARDEDWTIARLRREVCPYRRVQRLQPASTDHADLIILEGDALTVLPSLDQRFALLIADQVPRDRGAEDTQGASVALTDAWLTEVRRCLRPSYHAFLFCWPSYLAELEQHLRARDLPVRSRIAWHHPNVARAPSMGLRRSWTAIVHIGTHDLQDSDAVDVQTFAAPDADGDHWPKPVALVRWLTAIGSRPGDGVLDPCGGDTATLLACQEMGRRCTVIESNPVLASAMRARVRSSPADPRIQHRSTECGIERT